MSATAMTKLQPLLEELGFSRRSVGVYTIVLEPDVVGWLGLNTATRHQAAGSVEVYPIIGVRHQGVERLVAQLCGEKFHLYVPPTASTPIVYEMPEKRYRSWILTMDASVGIEADLVEAVHNYGLPFMQKMANVEELCAAVERGLGHNLEYRLPVIRLLLGRVAEAQAGVDEDIEKLGARDDQAAENLRDFAKAFHEALANGTLN